MHLKLSPVKIISLVIVGLIIMLVGTFVILTIIVNPNTYKPLIINSVEDISGRKLTIDGDITWTFFPSFGLQLSKISLSNPKQFSSTTNLLSLESLRLGLKPLALLHKAVVINELQFNGLKLNLLEQGNSNNWTFNQQLAPHSNQNATHSPIRWKLSSLQLKHTSVSWQNLDADAQHQLNDFNFELLSSNASNMKLESNQLSLTNAVFDYNSDIGGNLNLNLDLAKLKYSGYISVAPFSLNAAFNKMHMPPLNIHNPKIFDNVAFATKFNGNSNVLKLESINAQVGASNLAGNIFIDSLKPLAATENLTMDTLDLSDYFDLNGFKVPLKKLHLYGSFDDKQLNNTSFTTNLNAIQYLTIQNVTLRGLNIQAITAKLSQVSDNVIDVKQLIQDFNNVQAQTARLSSPSVRKNLNQTTNLGTLNAKIIIQKGILSTPIFKLAGPVLAANGKGTINLNQKTIDYTLYTQLYASKNSLLSYLIFPFHMYGRLSDFNSGVNRDSIQEQIVKYYTNGISDTVSDVGHNVAKDTKSVINSSSRFIKNLFK